MTQNIDYTQVYDEIEIEDLEFNGDFGLFTYPCPCGDKFQITLNELKTGQNIAQCPSCSLTIRIIYDKDQFEEYEQIMKELLVC